MARRVVLVATTNLGVDGGTGGAGLASDAAGIDNTGTAVGCTISNSTVRGYITVYGAVSDEGGGSNVPGAAGSGGYSNGVVGNGSTATISNCHFWGDINAYGGSSDTIHHVAKQNAGGWSSVPGGNGGGGSGIAGDYFVGTITNCGFYGNSINCYGGAGGVGQTGGNATSNHNGGYGGSGAAGGNGGYATAIVGRYNTGSITGSGCLYSANWNTSTSLDINCYGGAGGGGGNGGAGYGGSPNSTGGTGGNGAAGGNGGVAALIASVYNSGNIVNCGNAQYLNNVVSPLRTVTLNASGGIGATGGNAGDTWHDSAAGGNGGSGGNGECSGVLSNNNSGRVAGCIWSYITATWNGGIGGNGGHGSSPSQTAGNAGQSGNGGAGGRARKLEPHRQRWWQCIC